MFQERLNATIARTHGFVLLEVTSIILHMRLYYSSKHSGRAFQTMKSTVAKVVDVSVDEPPWLEC